MGICTTHRCRLVESSVPAKSEQSFVFCPAEHYTGCDKVVVEEDPRMIWFASYLESIFDAPMDFENDTPISSVLYHGMYQTKYLKASGRSRYTKMLADDLNVFYGGMGLCNIASMYQVQRVLLGSRSDFSVVCQIAFFLGMNPEELSSPTLTPKQIQQEQDSHYMKDAVPVDWVQLDADTAPTLEKVVQGIYDGTASEIGRPERVSERLVYREMGLLGHQLENMPKCRAIFERYTESYPESWARKIIWAYQRLRAQGKPFYWSDIRKLSGVKKKNFHSIIPYLQQYTDAETANRIVALIE